MGEIEKVKVAINFKLSLGRGQQKLKRALERGNAVGLKVSPRQSVICSMFFSFHTETPTFES